jgi:hypothetical protein
MGDRGWQGAALVSSGRSNRMTQPLHLPADLVRLLRAQYGPEAVVYPGVAWCDPVDHDKT